MKRRHIQSIAGCILALGTLLTLHTLTTDVKTTGDNQQLLSNHTNTPAPSFPSITIGSYTVSEEEIQYALTRVRNTVIKETAPKETSIGSDYFLSDAKNSPSARAATQALDYVHRRFSFYSTVYEAKLVDSPTWDSLVERYKKENQKRSEILKSHTNPERSMEGSASIPKDTLYGVQQFNLDTFISYEMSALSQRYCADENLPGMNTSESDIQHYYANHQWEIDSTDGTATPSLEEIRPNVAAALRASIFENIVEKRIESENIKIADQKALISYASAFLSK